MRNKSINQHRNELITDVAEMYYIQGRNQSEIAKQVGVTRSMISRMLTEARKLGIVHIRIDRPISVDRDLESQLIEKLGLVHASVVIERSSDSIRKQIGKLGAKVLTDMIEPGMTIGIPWGTTVNAVVEAIEVTSPIAVRVVQLVGAFGARNKNYDGHGLVQRLSEKFGGEGFFLNAPFYSENQDTTKALLENKSILESLEVAEDCDIAILGIGSTEREFSSFFNAGYLSENDFKQLIDADAVGDVCGLHFDIFGNPKAEKFEKRIVTVGRNRLLQIPKRIGIAGGSGKVNAIIGAIRAGLVNHLVTNSITANSLLKELI